MYIGRESIEERRREGKGGEGRAGRTGKAGGESHPRHCTQREAGETHSPLFRQQPLCLRSYSYKEPSAWQAWEG